MYVTNAVNAGSPGEVHHQAKSPIARYIAVIMCLYALMQVHAPCEFFSGRSAVCRALQSWFVYLSGTCRPGRRLDVGRGRISRTISDYFKIQIQTGRNDVSRCLEANGWKARGKGEPGPPAPPRRCLGMRKAHKARTCHLMG